ncbi:hypothetical protein HZB69_03125 [Candidatus Amesbacteria bacterium]|nr:hypothetical protein [Candidatus Amesbacteria bacterium]
MNSKEMNTQISQRFDFIVNAYLHLSIANHDVRCPYFMNHDDLYIGTPYYMAVQKGGKRMPWEIVDFVYQKASEVGLDLSCSTQQRIRDFIFEIGGGIDCSGFVYNITQYAIETITALNFETSLPKPSNKELTGVTKLNGRDIINQSNARSIDKINDSRPGDIISIAGGHHLISILDIDTHRNIITCAHSTNVIKAWGPNKFKIEVTNFDQNIFEQKWHEVDWVGENYLRSIAPRLTAVDGIKRLNIFSQIYGINY